MAPDFSLASPTEAGKTKLSDVTKTSPVLLIFWASWCPGCVHEIPEVNELAEKYKSKGLKVFGVNVQESSKKIQKFLKTHPMKYPVLMDAEGRVASSYGLVGLPAAVFVAKGGKILYYGFSLPGNIEELIQKGDSHES